MNPPQAIRATVWPARSVVMRKALPVLLTASIRAEVSSLLRPCERTAPVTAAQRHACSLLQEGAAPILPHVAGTRQPDPEKPRTRTEGSDEHKAWLQLLRTSRRKQTRPKRGGADTSKRSSLRASAATVSARRMWCLNRRETMSAPVGRSASKHSSLQRTHCRTPPAGNASVVHLEAVPIVCADLMRVARGSGSAKHA